MATGSGKPRHREATEVARGMGALPAGESSNELFQPIERTADQGLVGQRNTVVQREHGKFYILGNAPWNFAAYQQWYDGQEDEIKALDNEQFNSFTPYKDICAGAPKGRGVMLARYQPNADETKSEFFGELTSGPLLTEEEIRKHLAIKQEWVKDFKYFVAYQPDNAEGWRGEIGRQVENARLLPGGDKQWVITEGTPKKVLERKLQP